MPPALPEFQQYQMAFTRHIRDPERNARPAGVNARNMQIYNDLLFNNVFTLVSSCFPVTRMVLGSDRWDALIRSFFAQHRPRTPYFRQIPEEFLQFMQGREHATDDPDFLIYLLHYEWVELALEVSDKDADLTRVDAAGDLRSGRPLLVPVHMLLSYPYPVHRIGEDFQPGIEQREETSLLAFRGRDDKVRFIVLNAVSARLVHLIAAATMTGEEAVAAVVSELRHPDPAVATQGGHAILENLRQEGAILGTTAK